MTVLWAHASWGAAQVFLAHDFSFLPELELRIGFLGLNVGRIFFWWICARRTCGTFQIFTMATSFLAYFSDQCAQFRFPLWSQTLGLLSPSWGHYNTLSVQLAVKLRGKPRDTWVTPCPICSFPGSRWPTRWFQRAFYVCPGRCSAVRACLIVGVAVR